MSFITVPRETLEAFLTSKKFVASRAGNELTFERRHSKHPNAKMVVYTSIPVNGATTRSKGTDAIRVTVVFDGVGAFSEKRVNRSGNGVDSLLRRIEERMRDAAEEANKMLEAPCKKCGAPTYTDSGRCMDRMCRMGRKVARPAAPRPADVPDCIQMKVMEADAEREAERRAYEAEMRAEEAAIERFAAQF
jgi:hypothetical protein